MNVNSRRRRLATGVIAGLSALAVLTACGTGATGGGGGTDGDYQTSVKGNVVELSGADPDNLGGGLDVTVGLDLAISGSGAPYGVLRVAAAKLAAAQIKAAGGPNITFSIKDHKSGDAQAGVQTTRELGQEGVHLALYDYVGAFGSAYEGLAQYKILALDGGGGTAFFGQYKPFFYGARPFTPIDALPGIAKWIQSQQPDATTAALVVCDCGNVDPTTEYTISALQGVGIDLVENQTVPLGATDFSTAINKVIASGAPVVVLVTYGSDTALFLKQYRAAGGTAMIVGADWVPDIPEAAGDAADGYSFGTDFFDGTSDSNNEWGTYFADTWREANPDLGEAENAAANMYEDVFALWTIIQRVLAKDGDLDDGDQLVAALEEDPTFHSVYGNIEGQPYGEFTIDTETHSVAAREQYVFQYSDGALFERARFDFSAEDFELVD